MESSLFTKYKLDTTRVCYYHNTYKYRAVINIRGLQFVRVCNYNNSRINYCKDYVVFYNRRKTTWGEVIRDNENLIHALCEWIKIAKLDKNIKVFVGYDNLSIYYNDDTKISELLTLIQTTATAENVFALSFTESAKIDNFERGVIYLARPVYRYRIYFNHLELTPDEAQYLRDYVKEIKRYKANWSFQRLLDGANLFYKSRTYSVTSIFNSYIDINDDVHATYLGLFKPGIIKRVAKIEPRINNIQYGE